jgi:hypothetical protein
MTAACEARCNGPTADHDALTRKDIADWRKAWQLAINVDNPNRQRLYDIYRDADAEDTSPAAFASVRVLSWQNRSSSWTLPQRERRALHYCDQAWFKQLCRSRSILSIGGTVIELGGHRARPATACAAMTA